MAVIRAYIWTTRSELTCNKMLKLSLCAYCTTIDRQASQKNNKKIFHKARKNVYIKFYRWSACMHAAGKLLVHNICHLSDHLCTNIFTLNLIPDFILSHENKKLWSIWLRCAVTALFLSLFSVYICAWIKKLFVIHWIAHTIFTAFIYIK